jgi:hypothetical protein
MVKKTDNNEIVEIAPFESGELEDPSIHTGAVNGNLPGKLYQQIPCSIGFTYTRFEVDGSVKPCCVVPYPLANANEKGFDEVWHSSEYNTWRSKFLTIHKKKFHLHDVEFAFCQICPHIPLNQNFAKLLSEKWDDEEEA